MANEKEDLRTKKVKNGDKEDSIESTMTQSNELVALTKFYSQLSEDAEMIISCAKNEGRQDFKECFKRQSVRAVFGTIEGTIYFMKQVAKIYNPKMSAAELAMISEVCYDLNKGVAIEIKKYPKFKNNIKFAFSIYAKSVCGVDDYTLPVDEPGGWPALMNSIKVRDRLMHPKEPGDLDVTDDEFNAVEEAHRWFFKKFDELIKLPIKMALKDAGLPSNAIIY